MNGDLSITTPQQVARDLGAATGGVHAPALLRAAARETTALPLSTPEPEVAPDPGQLLEAARLRTLLTDPSMRVSTHHDDTSGRTVLQVLSRETGELVEQIPSDTILRLAAALREPLVDRQV
jgi:hypothetical protein